MTMRILSQTSMRVLLLSLTVLLVDAGMVNAQPSPTVGLPPVVIKEVDRIAPGFLEILDCQDSIAVEQLASTLQNQSSPEALRVLLWLLQHCSSWEGGVGPMWMVPIAAALPRVPLTELTVLLKSSDASRRRQGVDLLLERQRRSDGSEDAALTAALIAAVDHPADDVSLALVNVVRAIGTPDALAALERRASRPDTRRAVYSAVRGHPRPLPAVVVSRTTFPPAALTRLEQLFPGALQVLSGREPRAVRKLLTAFDQAKDSLLTPVLMWLFLHGDPEFGGWFSHRLHAPPYVSVLPILDVAEALNHDDPDIRGHVATLCYELLRGKHLSSAVDRARLIEALISRLSDPNAAVRLEVVKALGEGRSVDAVPVLLAALNTPSWSRQAAVVVVEALHRIGSPEALPVLERLALDGELLSLREAAATAFINVAKPADPAAEIRRLLWEPPRLPLEHQVIKAGYQALPSVWQALRSNSAEERRAAATLLAWYPDTASIPHILAALDRGPGARTRNQLLFDLSAILTQRGSPPDVESQRELATLHLRWVFDRIVDEAGVPPRFMLSPQPAVVVYPVHVPAPFSVALSAVSTPDRWTPQPQPIATIGKMVAADEYRTATANGVSGIVFQAINASHGVARVATVFASGRLGSGTLVTLYRHDGERWVAMEVPRSNGQTPRRLSNLLPVFNRDYGPLTPQRVIWLDEVMAQVHTNLETRSLLRRSSVDVPGRGQEVNATYAPLFERYQHSDSAAVRYAATLEHDRLTGKPNLPFWIDALEQEQNPRLLSIAMEALAPLMASINREGTLLDGSARAALVAAAVAPNAVNAALLPERLPTTEHVRRVRQSGALAVVEVGFGGSGYSMLFERRGDRWAFLYYPGMWIE